MKALHILYSGLSGVGNFFFSFVQGDEEKKFEYEAIFFGKTIRDSYVEKCSDSHIKWKLIKKKYRIDITFNIALLKAVAQSDTDAIFLDGSRFILPVRLGVLFGKKKKKIIVTERQANHLKRTSEWIGLVLAMFMADNIVFITESFKDEIQKKLKWIYQKKKIRVISNGIDLNFFKPAPRHPISEKVTIGMQSRLVSIKDHPTLIKAFAIVKKQMPLLKTELKIAGSGNQSETLKTLVDQLKLNDYVIFTGLLNEKDLLDFMHSLDIYVHSSYGEVMSMALMQAMACRVPIVASDVPGINNMIKNNDTGILVPPKDETAMANAVLDLINNKSHAEKIKNAAYNEATQHFSNKVMFEKYALLADN